MSVLIDLLPLTLTLSPQGEGKKETQPTIKTNLSLPGLFRQSIVPIAGGRSVGTMDRRNESGDDNMEDLQHGRRCDQYTEQFPSPRGGEGGAHCAAMGG